jgi:hypothetical protein
LTCNLYIFEKKRSRQCPIDFHIYMNILSISLRRYLRFDIWLNESFIYETCIDCHHLSSTCSTNFYVVYCVIEQLYIHSFLRLTIPRETIRSIITITWHSILDKEFIFNKMQIVSLDRNIMKSLFHSRFVRMCAMKSWNIGQARRFSLIIKSVIGMCMRSH